MTMSVVRIGPYTLPNQLILAPMAGVTDQPFRQLCRAFGISRQAFYAAQRGRQRPQVVRMPRRGPWASAQTLEAAIPLIVQSHPGWGVRKVWATLRRQGIVASHKRVWALMHALGLTLPAGERRRESTRGSVAVEGSNRRWASDLTATR